MEFILEMFVGTDTVKFGMTPKEVRAIFKKEPLLFRKSEVDVIDTEDYDGVQITYEEKDGTLSCCGIEFFETVRLIVDGVQIMGKDREPIEEMFRAKFSQLEIHPYHFGSQENEIMLSLTLDQKIQTLFHSRKGYAAAAKAYYEQTFEEKYGKLEA